MKKYLYLIAAITVSYALKAQEPQQQQQINVYPPATPPPPPTTTPPPAAPAAVVVEDENNEHHDAAFMLGFRYMPTISSFDVHTSEGVANGTFVLSHGFGGFIGFKTSEHFDLQLEVIY